MHNLLQESRRKRLYENYGDRKSSYNEIACVLNRTRERAPKMLSSVQFLHADYLEVPSVIIYSAIYVTGEEVKQHLFDSIESCNN